MPRHPLLLGEMIEACERIVNGYWSVEVDVLLSTARDDVPVLLSELRFIAG